MIRIILSLLIVACTTGVAYADNGAIAYAYPMNHLSIDGDVSDWPQGLKKYPIQIVRTTEMAPASQKDFQAFFRVGYNLESKSIYFAIEIIDDSHVVDRSIHPQWGQQDKHLLYFDPHHKKEGSCPISYSATQIKREIGGSDFSWDPQAAEASWDNVELQISRSESKTIYEYRIVVENIAVNTSLGLDHVMYDKDANDLGQERSYIMWGKTAGKSGAPNRCGDLILLPDSRSLVRVKGHIEYKMPGLLAGKTIRVSSTDNPELWTSFEINSLGNYEGLLPEGNYYLDFPDAFIDDIRIDQTKQLTFSVGDTPETIDHFTLHELAKPNVLKPEGLLHSFKDADTLSLDTYMNEMMNYYAIPGASIGIIINDELRVVKGYGVKNALTKEPVSESTIYQAASITKPVFAYTVLKLSDQGIIDLDKPLYKYLAFEELEDDERYQKMTARHVLSHQSGLPNWGRSLIFEPGTAHGYSGEGIEYLMRVVEKISNESILDILNREILAPMKMTENTYFVRESEMYAKVALGHHHNLPANNWIIDRVGMARSMYTEPKEFSHFILSAMRGEGLDKDTYQDMLTTQRISPFNAENPVSNWTRSFGLGFLMKESPWGTCYGHGGSNQYFQSLFEYYPDQRFGFVLFTNNDMGYHLGNDVREYLVIGKNAPQQKQKRQ